MIPRRYLLVLCFSLSGLSALAQKDSTYYFDKYDNFTPKANAEFWRVIAPQNNGLYKVTEYHKDSTWIVGFANGDVKRPAYEGIVEGYYKNGKLANKYQYKNGRLFLSTGYYPNGKVIHIIQQGNSSPQLLVYDADSSGTVHIINGEGVRRETGDLTGFYFNETYTMEGPYQNGLKNGVWKGHNGKGYTFEETYTDGKLISGITMTPDGDKHKYDKMWVFPDFKRKRVQLEEFIIKHIDAITDTLTLTRLYNRMALEYTVKANGQLADVYAYKNGDKVKLVISKSLPNIKAGIVRGVPADFIMKPNFILGYVSRPFGTNIYIKGQYKPATNN